MGPGRVGTSPEDKQSWWFHLIVCTEFCFWTTTVYGFAYNLWGTKNSRVVTRRPWSSSSMWCCFGHDVGGTGGVRCLPTIMANHHMPSLAMRLTSMNSHHHIHFRKGFPTLINQSPTFDLIKLKVQLRYLVMVFHQRRTIRETRPGGGGWNDWIAAWRWNVMEHCKLWLLVNYAWLILVDITWWRKPVSW